MKKIITIVSTVVAIFAVALIVATNVHTAKADLAGNVNILPYTYMKYATTSVSNSAASLVLATSTGRSYAVISNLSSYPVTLYLSNGAPVPFYANQLQGNSSCGFATCQTQGMLANGGLLLNASSTYTIGLDNLYQGAVYAIGLYSNTSVISVIANQ